MGRRRAARRTGRTDRLVSRRPRREPAAAGRRPAESGCNERGDGKSGEDILAYLEEHGASFFGQLHEAAGGGYPGETVDVLWDLVWRGAITNDTFHALRAFTAARAPRRRIKRPAAAPVFRSRRLVPPTAEGRWSLVHRGPKGNATRWAAAIAQQLLNRHGILTREAAGSDNLPGGFGSVYPVLKAMEEHGRIRRGYFVAGLGATQFALPGALELLRSLRVPDDEPEIVVLSATDPANPYGTTLKVPSSASKRAARVHADGWRIGHPRRRRTRRISRARRPPAVDVASRGGASTIASRPRRRARAHRSRADRRRCAPRDVDRGDRRHAARHPRDGAVARRSRLHRRRDGLPSNL